MNTNIDELLEYLIVTDQVDEFLGLKEETKEIEEDECEDIRPRSK